MQNQSVHRKNEGQIENAHQIDKTQAIKLKDLRNIQLIDYTGKIRKKVIDGTSPYAEIQCNKNKQIIVKKTLLCWLFNVDSKKISSDRLQRVQYSAAKSKCATIPTKTAKVRNLKHMRRYNPCRRIKTILTKKNSHQMKLMIRCRMLLNSFVFVQ